MAAVSERPIETNLVRLEACNPAGLTEIVQGHADRLGDLNGKTIGELSNGSWEAHRILPAIREKLLQRYPTLKIIPFTEFPRGTGNVEGDETTEILIAKGCDAVIIGNAACGSCSTAAGRAAAKAEKRGLPSVVVTRRGFGSIVDFAFAGLGFSTESPKQDFPMDVFLAESDLSLIDDAVIDGLVTGLTRWQPKKVNKVSVKPSTISASGADYQEAADQIQATFLRNLWSDGLPIVVPTESRVAWLMTGTDLPRQQAIGTVLPRGGIATVETIAIAAAMAGCRPEYMPVLIAAMEAILSPFFQHQHMQTATGSNHPAIAVNGAVARQIRLNAGYGCLGPSALYPAGASIGRAVRFLLTIVGGAVPGTGAMSIHGTPGKYTGLVFAEDEAGLPHEWTSLAEDRGLKRESNAVTVLSCSSSVQLWNGATTTENETLTCLDNYASCMAVQHGAYYANPFNPEGAAGILLIARGAAQRFQQQGWSKQRILSYLWDKAVLPKTDWLEGILDYFGMRKQLFVKDHIRYPMPIAYKPENIMMVVAGGDQSNHGFWLQNGAGIGPATREIRLPRAWDKLIADAETTLGPIPA